MPWNGTGRGAFAAGEPEAAGEAVSDFLSAAKPTSGRQIIAARHVAITNVLFFIDEWLLDEFIPECIDGTSFVFLQAGLFDPAV